MSSEGRSSSSNGRFPSSPAPFLVASARDDLAARFGLPFFFDGFLLARRWEGAPEIGEETGGDGAVFVASLSALGTPSRRDGSASIGIHTSRRSEADQKVKFRPCSPSSLCPSRPVGSVTAVPLSRPPISSLSATSRRISSGLLADARTTCVKASGADP